MLHVDIRGIHRIHDIHGVLDARGDHAMMICVGRTLPMWQCGMRVNGVL